MSQHDMDVANASGATFRADLNLALVALVGNSSGATTPSPSFAFQFWADSSANLLKVRNAANSAWITIGDLTSIYLGLLHPTATQNVTNKTLDTTNTITLKDSLFTLQDDGDLTKQLKLQLSGLTTGNTRTWTVPDSSDTFAGKSTTDVFTNKSMSGTTNTFTNIPSSAVSMIAPTLQKFTSGSGTYNKNYTFIITSGNATVGATYTHNSVTYTVYATVASSTQVVMSSSAAPLTSGTLTKASGTGDSTLTFSTFAAPVALRIIMVGGGGGGAGSGTTPGAATDGGNTTFGSSLLVANAGVKAVTIVGGAGGTASLGSGPVGIALSGGTGDSSGSVHTGDPGAGGGHTYFGGAGAGGPASGASGNAGIAAITNSGSGGGGAGAGNAVAGAGGGGGAGGFVRATITSPAATYAYAVGAAGSGGSAGTSGSAGANGGSGVIIVEELYQ